MYYLHLKKEQDGVLCYTQMLFWSSPVNFFKYELLTIRSFCCKYMLLVVQPLLVFGLIN